MLIHIPNGWKHACAVMISMMAGSNTEDASSAGFTHAAEHMMFAGTRKHSRQQLTDSFGRVFNDLEATTGREVVRLFFYIDRTDFGLAVDAVRQMLFHWEPDRRGFAEQKRHLLAEWREYAADPERAMLRLASRAIGARDTEPMGPLSRLRALAFSDLPAIRRHWDANILAAPRHVTVLGGGVTKQQLRALERTFSQDRVAEEVAQDERRKPDAPRRPQASPDAAVLFVRRPRPHSWDLLLDRIFYWRWYEGESYGEYDAYAIDHAMCFVLGRSESGSLGRQAEQLFSLDITPAEFREAKRRLLSTFRMMRDGTDPIGALHWFAGFQEQAYGDLAGIRGAAGWQRAFSGISYAAFRKHVAKTEWERTYSARNRQARA